MHYIIIHVTVHSVPSNTLRDAGNMNLLVQSPRSIVCFANLIYANRINSRGMSRVFCDLRSQKTPRGILPVNSNENAPHKMCVTICGRFCPDEGAVAGYGNRIRAKYTAKWGVQIAGMIFQTRSRNCKYPSDL